METEVGYESDHHGRRRGHAAASADLRLPQAHGAAVGQTRYGILADAAGAAWRNGSGGNPGLSAQAYLRLFWPVCSRGLSFLFLGKNAPGHGGRRGPGPGNAHGNLLRAVRRRRYRLRSYKGIGLSSGKRGAGHHGTFPHRRSHALRPGDYRPGRTHHGFCRKTRLGPGGFRRGEYGHLSAGA